MRKLLPILILCFCMGCAGQPISEMTTEAKVYKILHSSLSVYHLTMESVASLQGDGFISDEKRVKINDIASKYLLAHLVASRSLYAYKRISSVENEARLLAVLDESQKAFRTFLNYVEPILKEGVEK